MKNREHNKQYIKPVHVPAINLGWFLEALRKGTDMSASSPRVVVKMDIEVRVPATA